MFRAVAELALEKDSLPLRAKIVRRWLPTRKPLDGVAVREIGKLLDWMPRRFDPQATDTIRPWIPDFRYRGRTWALPEANFADVTVDEYNFIDTYLSTLKDNPENLLKVVAVMCRPYRPKAERKSEQYDGYPREHFNPEIVKQRARHLEKVPDYVKVAVLDFAIRMQLFLKARYGVLFEGGGKGRNWGWTGLMLSIAENGPFGKQEEVKKVALHTVLFYTVKKIVEAREREAEMEKMKRKHSR